MRPHVVHWLEAVFPGGVASALAPTWFTCVGLAGVVALFAMLAIRPPPQESTAGQSRASCCGATSPRSPPASRSRRRSTSSSSCSPPGAPRSGGPA